MLNVVFYPVNWPRIIFDLERVGLSDAEIAERVGCNKSNIFNLKTSEGVEPKHTLGEKILNLHYVYCLSREAPPPKPRQRRTVIRFEIDNVSMSAVGESLVSLSAPLSPKSTSSTS